MSISRPNDLATRNSSPHTLRSYHNDQNRRLLSPTGREINAEVHLLKSIDSNSKANRGSGGRPYNVASPYIRPRFRRRTEVFNRRCPWDRPRSGATLSRAREEDGNTFIGLSDRLPITGRPSPLIVPPYANPLRRPQPLESGQVTLHKGSPPGAVRGVTWPEGSIRRPIRL